MENITYTTDLSELLPLNAIANKILDMQSKVKSHTSNRIELLTSNQGHGLSSSILVSGQPLFNTKAKEIIKDYGVVEEWIDNYIVSAGIKAAADKRLEELDELYTAIDNEIQRLEGLNEDYSTTYTTDSSKIENVKFTDTIKNMIVNIAIPGSGVIPWVITSLNKYIKKAELYEAYYGDAGVITKNNKNIASFEERLTEIEEEMRKASAIYGGDYTALDRTSQTNSTNSDGNQTAAGDGQETDDETEKEKNIELSEYKEGDKVIIDKEEYSVYGYATDKDGNHIGIYTKNNKLYTINNNGKVEELSPNIDTKAGTNTYTINGQEYKYNDFTKSGLPEDTKNISSVEPGRTTLDDSGDEVTNETTDLVENTSTGGLEENGGASTVSTDNLTSYDTYHVTDENGNNISLYRETAWDSKGNIEHKYYYKKDGELVEAPIKVRATITNEEGEEIKKYSCTIDGVDYKVEDIEKGE